MSLGCPQARAVAVAAVPVQQRGGVGGEAALGLARAAPRPGAAGRGRRRSAGGSPRTPPEPTIGTRPSRSGSSSTANSGPCSSRPSRIRLGAVELGERDELEPRRRRSAGRGRRRRRRARRDARAARASHVGSRRRESPDAVERRSREGVLHAPHLIADRVRHEQLDRRGHPQPGRTDRRSSPAPTAGSATTPRSRSAAPGRTTILACRDPGRGEEALARMRADAPGRRLRAARSWTWRAWTRSARSPRGAPERVDLLINNAGVMAPPRARDRRRLRAAVRHQPPRPLRAHRAAARPARGRRRAARGHDRRQQHAQDRRASTWTTCRASASTALARLRALQAREPAVRVRAPAARDRGRLAAAQLAAHPGYAATELHTRARSSAARPCRRRSWTSA